MSSPDRKFQLLLLLASKIPLRHVRTMHAHASAHPFILISIVLGKAGKFALCFVV
jgi:hypothetical protein